VWRARCSALRSKSVHRRCGAPQHIAATATASYIAFHGASLAQKGVVHGFTVAFAVGAAILAAGAIVSAVFLTGPAKALSNPAARPALSKARS